MASTVIGVYDIYSLAEKALNDLLGRGFPRHALQLGLAEDTPLGRQSALRRLEQADDQAEESQTLPDFFRTLFGSDQKSDERDMYMEAVRRGSYLLIVHAEDDQQRDEAVRIMNRYDPVDIDERASEWRNRGWSHFDPTVRAMTDSEVDLERSLHTESRPTLPVQTVQGDPVKDEAAIPGSRDQLPIGRNEAQRLGVRIYQRGF